MIFASPDDARSDGRARFREARALEGETVADPLLTRIKADDESALLALIREHGRAFERIAFVTTRDEDLARDVVQDVCFDLWQRRAGLDVRGALVAYLRRAIHHRAVTIVRREHTQRRIEDTLRIIIAAHPSVANNAGLEAVEAEALSQSIAKALAALPPRCREIFLLHREAGLEYPRIAELLGISLPAVYNQMHRALRALAEAVEPHR